MALITQSGVSFGAGDSVSSVVDLERYSIQSAMIPANWTAAALTFQGSFDGINFFNVYTFAGSEVSWTAGASHLVLPDTWPEGFRPCRYLRARSGTAASPVGQVSAVVVVLGVETL